MGGFQLLSFGLFIVEGRVEDHATLEFYQNTTDTKIICNFCRKEFGHLSSLEAHMDHMHSGDSKHTCETCGKSFSSKSNLTAHKKIHSGTKKNEDIF